MQKRLFIVFCVFSIAIIILVLSFFIVHVSKFPRILQMDQEAIKIMNVVNFTEHSYTEMVSGKNVEFSNVRYSNNLCYDSIANIWITFEEPYSGWKGVRYFMSHDADGEELLDKNFNAFGYKNALFKPCVRTRSWFDGRNVSYYNKPSLLFFVWYDHFGHGLIEQLYSLYDAMDAYNWTFFPYGKIDVFLLTEKISRFIYLLPMLESFLRPSGVFGPNRQQDFDILCFREVIVGVKQLALNVRTDDHSMNGYRKYAIFILSKLNISIESQKVILICQKSRRRGRRILNSMELRLILVDIVGSDWTVKVQVMEELSFSEQIKIVASAYILITLSSTESHFMIFLGMGAFSIIVPHPVHDQYKTMNSGLCATTKTVICIHTNFSRCLSVSGSWYKCTKLNDNSYVPVYEIANIVTNAFVRYRPV